MDAGLVWVGYIIGFMTGFMVASVVVMREFKKASSEWKKLFDDQSCSIEWWKKQCLQMQQARNVGGHKDDSELRPSIH